MPKLRFPEFEGEYEVILIGKVFIERSENGDGTEDLLSVTMNEGVKHRTEIDCKDNSREDKSNYKIVKAGDMVYNSMRMWQGANGVSKYDGIVSPAYTVLKPAIDVNMEYIAAYFKTTSLINEFRRYSQGMTSDTWNLKYPQISPIRLYLPPLQEQIVVSNFLKCLDSRIAIQQKLIEALKLYKRGLLSKLFPQKGESVPQYRFTGFTDAWEQRKFGDILISLQNNTLSRAELSANKGVAKNVHYGDILVKFGEVLIISKEQLPMIIEESVLNKFQNSFLQNGDVVIADTAEDSAVGKCCEIAGLTDDIVISGLHTIPYRPKVKFASGYLGYYLNSNVYHQQLFPLMQGIKVTSISKSAMQNTDIIFPKSLEEQEKIGEYFLQLDNLITMHQRKYDFCKKVKFALLQQMFI